MSKEGMLKEEALPGIEEYTMHKRRRNPRLNKRLMVSFSENGFSGLGLTSNISKDGLCVASKAEFAGNAEVTVSIAVPGEILDLKGEVIWCKESNDRDNDVSDIIGIRITEAPPEYLNYVEHIHHKRDH